MKKKTKINYLLRREWERMQSDANKDNEEFDEVALFVSGDIRLWTKKKDSLFTRFLIWLFRSDEKPYVFKEHHFKNVCCYEQFCRDMGLDVDMYNDLELKDIVS